MKNINHHKIIDIIQMILFPRIGVKYLYQRERSIPQKTFPLPLARAIALLVSLLFSYLTVTPAFGQEPVGLGKTESRDRLKKTIIDLDKAIINLTKSSLLDEKAKNKIQEIYPGANLEKYPITKFDVDTNYVPVLKIGENISDQVMDMKLMLVESKKGAYKEMSLRDFSDKEWIILNGWADWCSPCKKSIELWEEIAPEFKDKIVVIGLHLDFDYKAPVIIERQQWTLQHIIGGEAFVLARHFLGQTIAGPSVFIHKGKLYGIATVKPKDKENVIKLLNNDLSPQDDSFRWYRKPLMMKGDNNE